MPRMEKMKVWWGWIATLMFVGIFLIARTSAVATVTLGIPWIYFFIALDSLTSLASHPLLNTIIATWIPVGINAVIIYFIADFLGNLPPPAPRHVHKKIWKHFNTYFWIVFTIGLFDVFHIPLPANYALLVAAGGIIETAKLGSVLILSYFGYRLSNKKMYLLLGILGIISLNIGLIVAYLMLFNVRNGYLKTTDHDK